MIDLNRILEHFLPDNVKVTNKIDDIRLKSNLNIKQTLLISKKSFFYTILGFVESHSGDIEGFVHLIPGLYKSVNLNNITGIDKIHLKRDCIDGSIVNGIRNSILYSFALDKPPGKKINREAKIKRLKKINKTVLFHITFYQEDDDNKTVNFSGETINFTCQLFKK